MKHNPNFIYQVGKEEESKNLSAQKKNHIKAEQMKDEIAHTAKSRILTIVKERYKNPKEFVQMSQGDKELFNKMYSSVEEILTKVYGLNPVLGKVIDKFGLTFEEEQKLAGESEIEQRDSKEFGQVIVVSGLSGVGKDTLIREFLNKHPEISKVVSVTTRYKRNGEEEGVDYHYLSREEYEFLFKGKLCIDRFDYAENSYSVPKKELEKRKSNKAIIFNVHPSTTKIMKQMIPSSKTILILPPNDEAQYDRLKARGTETEEQIMKRIKSDKELFGEYEDMFDYNIISEEGQSGIIKAATDLQDIIDGYKKRK